MRFCREKDANLFLALFWKCSQNRTPKLQTLIRLSLDKREREREEKKGKMRKSSLKGNVWKMSREETSSIIDKSIRRLKENIA